MPLAAEARFPRVLLLLVLTLSAVFAYFQLFAFPCVPRLATGDQGIYLHHAVRMLGGQLIYRDYDHFTLPGTDVFYALMFRIFGIRAWIAPATLITIAVTLVWLSLRISQHVIAGRLAFLPGALFLVLPFSGYLDGAHRWFSTVASISALVLLMEKRTPIRLMCAGSLWGLAVCFTQSIVVGALGVVFFLVWEHGRLKEPGSVLLKKEASFCLSLLATVLAFVSYFAFKAGLRSLIYYTVIFVARYYSADRFNSWRAYLAYRPSIHHATEWPDVLAFCLCYLIVPSIYVLFFVRYRRQEPPAQEPWDRLMLISFVGLFLFVSIAPSAIFSRVYTVSLPAFVLLVWFLKGILRGEKLILRATWVAVLVSGIARPAITQLEWKAYLELPTGRTAFFNHALYDKFKWVAERTQPGDYFLDDPHMCFALGLKNPARIPFLRPTDYTRPEEVQDFLIQMQNHEVTYISWYQGLGDENLNPAHDHLDPIRQYLHEHYRVATSFSNGDVIWELRQPSRPLAVVR